MVGGRPRSLHRAGPHPGLVHARRVAEAGRNAAPARAGQHGPQRHAATRQTQHPADHHRLGLFAPANHAERSDVSIAHRAFQNAAGTPFPGG